jgi:uncharacterized protein (TIGR00299 family) protein
MKICYIDAFSGISGDMIVGALADAGADTAALSAGLCSLDAGAVFRFQKVSVRGIGATKFTVETGEQKRHRHLPEILRMISQAELPEPVKTKAAEVFKRLGEAEAKVHGVAVDKVHFHEIGAVDSIADIVGACLGFYLLNVEEIVCSPLNLGSGTVSTEHGELPVPAPATAVLVSGCPVYARGPGVELTTPTGAALAKTLAKDFGPLPPMRIRTAGYGAGDHQFESRSNVLRVLVGDSEDVSEAVTVTVIEANIDDLSPQVLGYAMERLLARGALDVTLTPLLMKKNRPGTLLRVLARPEDREELIAVLFRETSTLGLRMYQAERRVQSRSFVEVETPHGKVRVKVSADGSYAPEYEDCRKLALATGVPLKQILAEAGLAYLKTQP